MKGRLDPFLVGMAVAVALAWLYPDAGAREGWLQPEYLNKAGISLIFFLHGAALPLAALRSGTLKWRAHLVIQLSTFGLFPLLGLLLWSVAGEWLSPDLALGVVFLCALPSTVSSSVALTATARGNVAVAVFNATLSSLAGIVLTPLWMSLVFGGGQQGLPLLDVILDLVRWLLAPFAAGQLLRPLIGDFIVRHKRQVGRVDRATILLLVYTSFADSVATGLWANQRGAVVLGVVVLSAVLFVVVLAVMHLVSVRLGFPRDDRIAVIFCGSKKSLASGVPMAHVMFAGVPGVGVILLPIMVYHSLQLLAGGWLAGRWAREAVIAASKNLRPDA